MEEGTARAATQSIDGVYVEKMETPPGGSLQSEGGVSYVEGSPAVINRRDVRTGQVAQDRSISVSNRWAERNQLFARMDGFSAPANARSTLRRGSTQGKNVKINSGYFPCGSRLKAISAHVQFLK